MKEEDKKIIVFKDKNIRRTWNKNEWYFCIIDIIEILSESKNPRGYLKDMRRRDEYLSKGWVQIATPLPLETKGGVQTLNCANKEGIFRIIQSIPSKKAEPFKLWLAKVGSDRIDEIENPELAQERMKNIYKKKGYSKEWIDKRIRGIAIRQDLTEEWDNREIEKEKEYAILTNEISMATFGKTIQEYKELKNLNKENLRDHMNDWELILTMIGEKATTEITQEKDSIGFDDCKDSATKGGEIAGRTRMDLEKSLGKPIISNENYIEEKERKEKERKKKRIIHMVNN